jgi:hypothetical protein
VRLIRGEGLDALGRETGQAAGMISEGHKKIPARLRLRGFRTSRKRVPRLARGPAARANAEGAQARPPAASRSRARQQQDRTARRPVQGRGARPGSQARRRTWTT